VEAIAVVPVTAAAAAVAAAASFQVGLCNNTFASFVAKSVFYMPR